MRPQLDAVVLPQLVQPPAVTRQSNSGKADFSASDTGVNGRWVCSLVRAFLLALFSSASMAKLFVLVNKWHFHCIDVFLLFLVDSYRHCGDYKTALEVWRTETLPVYLEQLGDHPWTASILQHIASMYLELARQDPLEYADLAETYTRQALHLRVRLLGFHQDTARSHICLSDVFIIQGKLDQALDGLDMALEIQEDVLGVNQQDTVDTLNKITDLLKRLGRHHEAKERRRRSELLSQKFACK